MLQPAGDLQQCVASALPLLTHHTRPLSCSSCTLAPTHPNPPPQINTDPYGEGWMVKVKLSNPDELKELMSAKEYEEFCG